MKNSLEKTFEKVTDKKSGLLKSKSVTRVCSIVGAGIGMVIWLNLAIYFQKTLVEDARLKQLDRLASQRAKILAESAEIYVASVEKNLEIFAKKPTVSAALALGNQDALERLKNEFSQRMDDIKSVNLIPKGKAALDPDASPPIRFTELEMIRRAELREEVLPEAIKIGDKWLLNFIVPLPFEAEQETIGVAMVTLATDELAKRVLQGKASLGKVVLQQQFAKKKPLPVFSIGEGSLSNVASHPIKNSYWQIHFTPSYAMYESAKIDKTKAYAIIAGIFLVLVIGGGVLGRMLGRTLEKQRERNATTPNGVEKRGAASTANLADPLYAQTDILDVDLDEQDEALLGLEDVAEARVHSEPEAEEDILDVVDNADIPDVIFRAYDIRGIAKDQVTTNLAKLVGQALGSEAIDAGQDTLVVARDARITSPELTEFLIRGILSTGCNVLNIGTVPTPLMYFATATLKETQSGVMVTASHNPAEYNGFKVVINGKSRCDEDIKSIRRRILKKDLYEGVGTEKSHDIIPHYIDTIFSDVALAGDVSIVIDAANGVTGKVAPRLFEELGCHVEPLFCELNGEFPNHSPDPSIESNLTSLIDKVKETGADLGVAFDGDGDRIIVVTSSGQIIWPDQLLMLFAKDIVSRNPGADVVFDVKSTKHLVSCITSYGGRPIMWKTGHAPMKNKMAETGALLGGEYSGHIFIKDRWFGFDDGMYAAARLIEILSLQGESLDMIFDEFPKSPATPEIRVPVSDEKKFDIISELAATGNFAEGRVTTIDGIRVDYPFGWGLVRASNTSPNLTLRFEADDEDSLHKVKAIIAKELKIVDSTLQINWNT